ncbi:fas-associated death domain protein isoform X1 [Malaya genurostris]|uniref:fas-associated death domain protein isoform X1 n=1 Tax=Malaya genurostris TaxID=325434 RepID=UPI0026F3F101|nr:fas-associated death domain protein isoform X1 [Malaya genurostris]
MTSCILKDRSKYDQLSSDYLLMKSIVCKCCADSQYLQKYKDALKADICSNRKLSRIKRSEELLLLMETRNLLSMIKIDLFIKLEPLIGDMEFAKLLGNYEVMLKENFGSIRRFYLEDLRRRDRRTLLEKEIEHIKLGEAYAAGDLKPRDHLHSESTNPTPTAFSERRKEIYNLLINEIGRDWNTLGRHLQLSSATLFEIEERCGKDVKARIHDILEEAERDQVDEQHFVDLLGTALISTRRRDLKRKIDKLLS